MKTKTTFLVVFLLGACAWRSSAQAAFDTSGDGLLKGAYYMRQVLYIVGDQTGDIGEAMNVQGTITFDGSGSYTFTGSLLDSASSSKTPVTYSATGTYAISASGEGYISGVNSNFTGDQIVGLVSHGIFIGSSTENGNGYNDLFIAAPIGTAATNAALNGSYTVAYLDPTFPGGGDALFAMTANGQGSIGTVNVTSYIGNTTSASTETLTNVTYSFSNGAAQVNFGGNPATALVAGTELLYISPDGNFVFGGSYNGYDMFAGVRGATSNPSNYDGLYYQAGLDLDQANAGSSSSSYSLLDSYYGSLQAFSQNIIGHQRLNSPLVYGGSSDFTYYDSYMLSGNGGSTDTTFAQQYVSSTDGTIRIGYGVGPFLALNVAFQAPAFNGTGVYLSPVGVVNAASSAPFTAFISPGEFLTLYGSGLASATKSSSLPFKTELDQVQVFINQVAAPIYYVSPTQISVIVPYITAPGTVAQIQVVNNGVNSNIVTAFTGMTSVGVFTNNPVGGIGTAAAERPGYSIVSESNPAQIGETIALYVAGMGAVNPTVTDGSAAPTTTLSNTTNTPQIWIADSAGNYLESPTPLPFSGLAPGFAGLYQINFAVPTGLAAGDTTLEVIGPDSDTFEALFPVAAASAAASTAADRAQSDRQRPRVHHRRLPVDQLRFSGRLGAVRRPAAPQP
jgi:uncharacterized protein (TIGR03437 family)